uniref:Citrate transporter-like domain-containing protein n=1 Tax=Micromonas pusilla TaxID=38833 RepID=A0A7S0DF95_MICPS|mmetsp:Transcript_9928/g.42224  ORF Transcript_9928/g.42224 Transcript_9928/m.42224 type:complete len:1009 (+) Transcript_9928:281-3307(+)
MSGNGKRPPGPRRSLDGRVEAAAEDFEEHGHTLSAMQGRRLRNELSGMALRGVDGFEGEDALGADEGVSPGSTPVTSPGTTPSTTLTGDEQVALSRAIASDPFAPRALTAAAARRESMPPSSGHARLSATLFAPPAMGAIGEDVSVHAGRNNGGARDAPAGDDDWKAQLEASDDEAEPEPFPAAAADPADVAVAVRRSSMKPSSLRRGSMDIRRDVPSSNAGGLAKRAKNKTAFGALPGASNERRAAKPGGSAGDEGLEGTSAARRNALRSVARDVESLMLISEALSAKEMPVLAKRLREGLARIQDNARAGYKKEGLHARRQSALRRVNRFDLFREAAADLKSAVPRMPRMSVNFGPRMSVNFGSPRKSPMASLDGDPDERLKKAGGLTFRDHCVRAGIIGVILLVLCCIPHILHQYEPESAIGATAGSYVVDGVEPVSLRLSHNFPGLYEITLGAGKCDAYAPATDTVQNVQNYYVAKVALTQDGTVLKSDYLMLHDKGIELETSSRRALLSGGGASGPTGADVFETFYFNVDPSASGSDLVVEVRSDCPAPLGISVEALSIGPVGVSQHWIALALLILVFALIITEVVHRTLIAFMGAAAVLFLLALEHRLPSVYEIMQWMDHGTLALLWGMMIIVALLARSGVFEYSSVRLIEASGMDMWRLTWMLMLFDCVLSAFLDNVSTMLLLGPVIVSLCKAIDMDPRPMLIPMALFGNIGGTSTMIGDPPNLIIGNAFQDELGFVDFLRVLAPGVLLTLPPALAFLRWYYGKEVYSKKIAVDMEELKAKYPIRDFALLARCGIILSFVLLLFFLHPVVHFEPAYAALFGAIAILLMGSAADFEHALEKVEWDSLLFFAGLFVFTEGIAELGLLRIIADQLSSAIEVVDVDKRAIVSSVLVQVVAAVASAFVDNIPFTTTMIPVISRMAKNVEGLTIQPLAWALCFGADYGGMGTIIGASANVVMAGVAAEAGFPVSFMSFFKIGWPMMCLSLCVSVPYLALMIHVGYVK